ncbi:MAG: Stp1/IreP family PP2C-type Ser/Thr phosphatase [Acidimicrobiales bacterium]
MTVLRSGSATDVGRVRKINQDLPLESLNLFAVADGMGGHVGGEVAARVAIDTLLDTFTREPTTSGLQGAFTRANQAVWQESQDQSDLHGMGTTLTAVALVGGADGRDMLALANVGDSRAYVYSEGTVTQITADHSLAEERMRQGEMTEEEAAVHPQRHILTRALGVSPDVEADMWELQLRSGDRLVLCSDGLSNEVTDEELGQVLAAQPDPAEAARRLVAVANDHGGNDNITVVVVDVLVGEEGTNPASVVKPIGKRAGPPLIVAPAVLPGDGAGGDGAGGEGVPEDGADGTSDGQHDGATTPGPPTAPTRQPHAGTPDVLAPGAQLGFVTTATRLSSDGPESGENFLNVAPTGPIARTSVRAAAAPIVAPAPPNESRRARRRRLGIPRRITVRVVLFVLLVLAIPVAVFFVVRWYAYDNWYPAVGRGNEIVIYQGRPGGVLWFDPKVVDRTGVTTSQILAAALADIHAGVEEPSLQKAKTYVTNLHQAYLFQHSGNAASGGSSPTGIGPSGSTTTTTTIPKPGTGQPLVPGATAVSTTTAPAP